MSEDLPLVSIITACLNSADYIEDNMASVAAQTYPNIEHVFIDGGSTDGTVDLIREYAKDHLVTWVSEPDDGPAPATAKGVKMASGEVVGILPSDDTMYPWSAATGAEYLSSHPDVDIVHGDIVTINPSGSIDIRLHKPFNRNYMLRTQCMPSLGTYFRQPIMEETPGAEEDMGIGDFAFWMTMTGSHVVRNIPEVLAVFRKRDDSYTGSAANQGMVRGKQHLVRSRYANPQSRKFKALQFWDRVYGAFYRRLLLMRMMRRSSRIDSGKAVDDPTGLWNEFLGAYAVSFANKAARRNMFLPNRSHYDVQMVPRDSSDSDSTPSS